MSIDKATLPVATDGGPCIAKSCSMIEQAGTSNACAGPSVTPADVGLRVTSAITPFAIEPPSYLDFNRRIASSPGLNNPSADPESTSSAST
jgi:hypothetical protein